MSLVEQLARSLQDDLERLLRDREENTEREHHAG